MALKIRLRQQGRTNRKLFRVVVTEGTASRDGRYVEMLGWYNPHEKELEKELSLNIERVQHWLNNGAILTDKAQSLVAKVAPEVIKAKTATAVAKRSKRAAQRKKK